MSEASRALPCTPKQPDLVVREFLVQLSAGLLRQVSPPGMFLGYLPSHQAACGALTTPPPQLLYQHTDLRTTVLIPPLFGLDWLLPSSACLHVSIPREPESAHLPRLQTFRRDDFSFLT